jgi:hypothetical protein
LTQEEDPFMLLRSLDEKNFLLIKGRLAQVVEHLTFNQVVEGSNPSAPTTYLPGLFGLFNF